MRTAILVFASLSCTVAFSAEPIDNIAVSLERNPIGLVEHTVTASGMKAHVPADPFAMIALIKNTSKQTVKFESGFDMRIHLDFVVRKDGRTVSVGRLGDAYGDYSLRGLYKVEIPPDGNHKFYVTLSSHMIPKKDQGAGTYTIWCCFKPGEKEIYSSPFTLKIEK